MSDKKKAELPGFILDYDKLVRASKYDEAFAKLQKIFALLEGGKEGFGAQIVTMNDASERDATLLATAFTNMLVAKDFKFDRKKLYLVSQHKRVISQTFEVSGYRGTRHLMDLLGRKDKDGRIQLKGPEILKLFCGLSLNAMTLELFELLKRQKKELAWPIVSAFLTEQVLHTEQAEKVREAILASADHWMDVEPDDPMVRNIGPSYMGCSYAHAPHKHDIKLAMNSLVRRWLEKKGITDLEQPATGKRGVKRKPTLVLIAELYNATHAMHRCYGPAIRSLKDRFKVIYMSADGECDKALHHMFDKIDDTKLVYANPKPFFDKVKSYRPDVIYYPSIGMRLVSIMGSNLRLAPIQMMTYGHPATPRSEFIDYSVLVKEQLGDPATVQEKILYRPSRARWERRSDAADIPHKLRVKAEYVRIAVPAWSRKITPVFLKTCQRIAKRSKRKVEFIFFPNGSGSLFQAGKRRIESMLNAKVLPRAAYNTYIDNLNKCDIFLSTFPFGATNGIIDAAKQGLPVVNLKGGEVHSKTDSDIVSKINQPAWLSTNSIKEFENAVVRLIDNESELHAISKSIMTTKFDETLFVSQDDDCEEFGEIVEAAYRNHEALMESDSHTFEYEELKAMLAEAKSK